MVNCTVYGELYGLWWIVWCMVNCMVYGELYGLWWTVWCMVNCIIIIINPLTARVVGAPQMILQPVFSIVPCSPLPSGTCRTPGLSIPWCCLPTSSSVCLVFFPPSLCFARWFWPDLMNGRWPYHCSLRLFTVVRRSSCGPIASWILARTSSLTKWSFMRCVVSCGNTSFPWPVFFLGALRRGSMIHKHTRRRMWQGSASVVFWVLFLPRSRKGEIWSYPLGCFPKLQWKTSVKKSMKYSGKI